MVSALIPTPHRKKGRKPQPQQQCGLELDFLSQPQVLGSRALRLPVALPS